MRALPYATALIAWLVAGSPCDAAKLTLATRDGPRTAELFMPEGAKARPLVVALHGGGGRGEGLATWSGLAARAGARGFASVFPDGLNRQWNDGRDDFRGSVADDVAFLRALVKQLVDDGVADPARIYVTGLSNGGMMTTRLLCEMADRIAGAAVVIASLPRALAKSCAPARPVPILIMNGTADPLVPYRGGGVGPLGGRGTVISTPETFAFFGRVNGCTGEAEQALPDRDTTDRSSVVLVRKENCRAPTLLYRIDGGGHQLPGGRALPESFAGIMNRDIDGATVIMDFFAGLK